MPEALVAAVAAVALIVLIAVGLSLESYRRNRRFSKRISPYERHRSPGRGQELDPDDVPRR